eukprot:s1676_g5.t1
MCGTTPVSKVRGQAPEPHLRPSHHGVVAVASRGAGGVNLAQSGAPRKESLPGGDETKASSSWSDAGSPPMCNKCGQADPHLSDSWCLACTAHEAIGGELRLSWGLPGTHALATDILVSAVRQVRALRRLGIAGGGRVRPASPQVAGTGPAPAAEAAPAPGAAEAPPSAPEAPKTEEKPAEEAPAEETQAVKEEAHESSEYTEGSSEEEPPKERPAEEEVPKKPQGSSGLSVVPKAKADHREDLPRRRSTGENRAVADSDRARSKEAAEDPPRGVSEADYDRAASPEDKRSSQVELHPYRRRSRERSRRRDDDDRRPRSSREVYTQHRREADPRRAPLERSHRESRGSGSHYWHQRRSRSRQGRAHRDQGHQEGKKKNTRKRKRTHRAGSKHQQVHRAAEDPFRRFHQRPPDTFWDRPPSPP